MFNVYHVWKTSQGAQEIPPDYDDKGELSPIPAMKGKSYDMSCSSDSLRVCVKPEEILLDITFQELE